jgi:hypothetical protein
MNTDVISADKGLDPDIDASAQVGVDADVMAYVTYYVSSSQGQDDGPGTVDRPWKTLGKVSTTVLGPGTSVLLRRGDVWEENLVIASSGTSTAPLTFGAYGSGDAPLLLGSDAIPATAWAAGDTAGTWVADRSVANCVSEDDQMLRSTALMTGNTTDSTTNLTTMAATTGTWFFDGKKIYVHTVTDPRTNGRKYRICAREDLVNSNGQSYVVVRNLALTDSAKAGGGYAARIQGGDHVTVEDVVAKRAGKHHFGAMRRTPSSEAASWASMPSQIKGMEELPHSSPIAQTPVPLISRIGSTVSRSLRPIPTLRSSHMAPALAVYA